MWLLPAGLMMAAVAEAIEAGRVPDTTSATALFVDDGHHPSDLGNYLLAMTVYMAAFGRLPETVAAMPTARYGRPYAGLGTAATVTAIRNVAWENLTTFYRSGQGNHLPMSECRRQLPERCGTVEAGSCNEAINRIFVD
jgi:hypothetical protein